MSRAGENPPAETDVPDVGDAPADVGDESAARDEPDAHDAPVARDEPDAHDVAASTAGTAPRWPFVLAVVALVIAGAAGVRVVQLMGDRDDLREQNAGLAESLRIARGDAGEQIEALESEIDGLAGELDAAGVELEAASSDLDRVRTERNQITAQLAERTAELETATERLDEIDARLEELGRIEPMPELVGADVGDAQAFADDLGATLLVEEVAPGNVIARPGAVIEQLPPVGTPIVAGSVVWVQVFTLAEGEPGA